MQRTIKRDLRDARAGSPGGFFGRYRLRTSADDTFLSRLDAVGRRFISRNATQPGLYPGRTNSINRLHHGRSPSGLPMDKKVEQRAEDQRDVPAKSEAFDQPEQ